MSSLLASFSYCQNRGWNCKGKTTHKFTVSVTNKEDITFSTLYTSYKYIDTFIKKELFINDLQLLSLKPKIISDDNITLIIYTLINYNSSILQDYIDLTATELLLNFYLFSLH